MRTLQWNSYHLALLRRAAGVQSRLGGLRQPLRCEHLFHLLEEHTGVVPVQQHADRRKVHKL
jgi:hypothetical protein